jgi:hypothetical protein
VLEKGLNTKFSSTPKFDSTVVPFPQNLLRNVALQYVTGAHVIVLDADFAVSKDLAVEHARAFAELTRMGLDMSRVAIVVPGESVVMMMQDGAALLTWAALVLCGHWWCSISISRHPLQHLRRSTVLCASRPRATS